MDVVFGPVGAIPFTSLLGNSRPERPIFCQPGPRARDHVDDVAFGPVGAIPFASPAQWNDPYRVEN
jgi:hypothetical protein